MAHFYRGFWEDAGEIFVDLLTSLMVLAPASEQDRAIRDFTRWKRQLERRYNQKLVLVIYYLHAVLEHEEMPSRVRWIRETLQNPEVIYRHWQKPFREIYVNIVFESEDDEEGSLHVVVVGRRGATLKLWTSFLPQNPDDYRERVEAGDLLWKPSP